MSERNSEIGGSCDAFEVMATVGRRNGESEIAERTGRSILGRTESSLSCVEVFEHG